MPDDSRHAMRSRTGQIIPGTHGEIIRCILESLALRYRKTLESLEQVLGRRFSVIHIVGGGCQNRLLNQMAADCTGRPVIAGPAEATAIGNLLTIGIAAGQIDPTEQQAIISRSFPTQFYEPSADRGAWEEHYQRFLGFIEAQD